MTAKKKSRRKKINVHPFAIFILVVTLAVDLVAFSHVGLPELVSSSYKTKEPIVTVQVPIATTTDKIQKEVFTPIRLKTPESVKAIYMTQCVLGTPNFRDKLVKIAQETEINAIIIDIKDYSGGLGFIPEDPELTEYISETCRAHDIKEFVRSINEKGIYAIARITVFQDPKYASRHPDLAVQKESDKTIWKDYKGLSFIDVGAQEAWDYILAISHEAYNIGFDELNYDYIRFPSDGNMRNIYFPQSEENLIANPEFGKAEVLEEFFAYLDNGLNGLEIKTSADLFGMVTTNIDDLNIGQQLERALPYFDYISPMVYPSHFPTGFNGWENPNDHVYDIIAFSMGRGIERVKATTTRVATLRNSVPLSTSTPPLYSKKAYPATKLRPWLQDFDYGGNYDVKEVQAQIQAAYDSGLNSWMLWDPTNLYTVEALLPEPATSTITREVEKILDLE